MRQRWWIGLAGAALLILPAAGYAVTDVVLPAPATSLGGLPAVVDAPWIWAPTAEQAPPGRTSAVIGGSTFGLRNLITGEGTVDLVDGDRHTLLPFEFDGVQIPGETLLLSPDGSRVAYPDGEELAVRDLTDGSVRLASSSTTLEWYLPLAWAPDGNRLLTVQDTPGSADLVGELDVDSGRFTELAPVIDAGLGNPVPGFSAAYHPDGQRSVVQIGDQLHMFTAGVAGPVLDLPEGTRLAGKGAWALDGRGIAVVRDADGTSQLLLIDAVTGEPVTDAGFAPLTGVLTQRLLGWLPSGEALVVCYAPEPDAPVVPDPDSRHEHATAYAVVRRVDVSALAPDGGVRPVLTPPEQVLAIDLADQALAAAGVPGGAAPVWAANPAVVAAAGVPVALGLLLVARLAGLRRRPRTYSSVAAAV